MRSGEHEEFTMAMRAQGKKFSGHLLRSGVNELWWQ